MRMWLRALKSCTEITRRGFLIRNKNCSSLATAYPVYTRRGCGSRNLQPAGTARNNSQTRKVEDIVADISAALEHKLLMPIQEVLSLAGILASKGCYRTALQCFGLCQPEELQKSSNIRKIIFGILLKYYDSSSLLPLPGGLELGAKSPESDAPAATGRTPETGATPSALLKYQLVLSLLDGIVAAADHNTSQLMAVGGAGPTGAGGGTGPAVAVDIALLNDIYYHYQRHLKSNGWDALDVLVAGGSESNGGLGSTAVGGAVTSESRMQISADMLQLNTHFTRLYCQCKHPLPVMNSMLGVIDVAEAPHSIAVAVISESLKRLEGEIISRFIEKRTTLTRGLEAVSTSSIVEEFDQYLSDTCTGISIFFDTHRYRIASSTGGRGGKGKNKNGLDGGVAVSYPATYHNMFKTNESAPVEASDAPIDSSNSKSLELLRSLLHERHGILEVYDHFVEKVLYDKIDADERVKKPLDRYCPTVAAVLSPLQYERLMCDYLFHDPHAGANEAFLVIIPVSEIIRMVKHAVMQPRSVYLGVFRSAGLEKAYRELANASEAGSCFSNRADLSSISGLLSSIGLPSLSSAKSSNSAGTQGGMPPTATSNEFAAAGAAVSMMTSAAAGAAPAAGATSGPGPGPGSSPSPIHRSLPAPYSQHPLPSNYRTGAPVPQAAAEECYTKADKYRTATVAKIDEIKAVLSARKQVQVQQGHFQSR